MEDILDGYKQFFEYVKKEDFFKFGLDNIITIDQNTANVLWKKLVNDINNKSNNLYIRSFGKNGRGNNSFKKLYKDIFGIEINFDETNNNRPTRLLGEFTAYKKNKNIFNYQVSHVFGNTKNVFCFVASWNIVYIPKILDPLTGHEAIGEYTNEFKKLFHKKIFQLFINEIDEYNRIMESLSLEIQKWVNLNIKEKDKKNILKEFDKIDINNK